MANASLLRSLRKEAELDTALASIGRVMTASTDIAAVFPEFVRQVAELLDGLANAFGPDRKSADRITREIMGNKVFRTHLSKFLVFSPLYDSE
jgi:hypothetical protein